MLKESNYLSPECLMLKISAEGVLCSSVDNVDASGSEKFNLDDFIW